MPCERSRVRIGVCAVLVAAGALAGPLGAQPSAEGPLPFSTLKLHARVAPAHWLVGQPLIVYVELRNPTGQAALAHDRFGW